MTTRDDWIAAGLDALAQDGLPGVRIDRIAARLGVSKGSFHHHFDGAAGYRRELLRTHEERAAAALGAVTGEGFTSLDDMLAALDDLYDPRIETALRAWSVHDDDAAEAVRRIDRVRLDALRQVWASVLPDDDRARVAALVPHLVVVGAAVSPDVTTDDLRAVLTLLARLAPGVPDALGTG